jgi:hypothetical protein
VCRYNFEKGFSDILRSWLQPNNIPSPEDISLSEEQEEILRRNRDLAADPETKRVVRQQFENLFDHVDFEDGLRPDLDDLFED